MKGIVIIEVTLFLCLSFLLVDSQSTFGRRHYRSQRIDYTYLECQGVCANISQGYDLLSRASALNKTAALASRLHSFGIIYWIQGNDSLGHCAAGQLRIHQVMLINCTEKHHCLCEGPPEDVATKTPGSSTVGTVSMPPILKATSTMNTGNNTRHHQTRATKQPTQRPSSSRVTTTVSAGHTQHVMISSSGQTSRTPTYWLNNATFSSGKTTDVLKTHGHPLLQTTSKPATTVSFRGYSPTTGNSSGGPPAMIHANSVSSRNHSSQSHHPNSQLRLDGPHHPHPYWVTLQKREYTWVYARVPYQDARNVCKTLNASVGSFVSARNYFILAEDLHLNRHRDGFWVGDALENVKGDHSRRCCLRLHYNARNATEISCVNCRTLHHVICGRSLHNESASRDREFEHMIRNMTVTKKETGSYQRVLSSADDRRRSAHTVGYLGVLLISLFFGSILFLDILNLRKFVMARKG